MMETNDFGLEQTIKGNEIENISKDVLEVGLDSLLNNGIIKDLPIVSILHGIVKTGINIRDALFLNKIIKLLYETKDIPREERERVINRINKEQKYKFSVGEKLVYIIDKSDDLQKIEYIASLFKVLLEEKINFEQFLRCADSINKSFVADTKWFIEHYSENEKESSYHHRLFAAGLLQLKFNDRIAQNQHGLTIKPIEFELSKPGKLVRLYCK